MFADRAVVGDVDHVVDLRAVPDLGGRPHSVMKASFHVSPTPRSHLSWHPDGEHLVYGWVNFTKFGSVLGYYGDDIGNRFETPLLYGPLTSNSFSFYVSLSCSPCLTAYNHRTSPCDGDNICLKSVSPEEVLVKAYEMLGVQEYA